LKGWWIPGEKESVIFVIHGYAANRAGWVGKGKDGKDETLDWLAAAPPLQKAGFNLVYFDLRAHGESGGDLITLAKFEAYDLLGAINWMQENKRTKSDKVYSSIGLLGMSMGANIALRGALELKNMNIQKSAIIAIGAYRYDTMIDKSIRYWTSLPSFLIPVVKQMARVILGFDPSLEIDPSRYVDKISPTPVMFIQAEKDEIGDVADVHAIYNKAKKPKELVILPDAPRYDAYQYAVDHSDKVVSYFSKYLLK